jgi:DNA-binding beta-propeller fold protein YncE
MRTRLLRGLSLILLVLTAAARADEPASGEKHLLYVTTPGIRADLQYGGSGILVFDIDNGHKFVRRIPTRAADATAAPQAMKGVCASATEKKLWFCTPKSLTCVDLLTDKILWEKAYPGGCDRMSVSPDDNSPNGPTIYLPSFESDWWNVVDGRTGDVLNRITPKSGSHNTVFAPDGKHVYLAGLKSKVLTIASAATRDAESTCGPFGGNVRPFTVNGKATLCFCCVNDLLGFEIGDLATGKVIQRVEIQGFAKGAVKRHGCPSHGIGMTPDESEIWVSDGHNQRMHVFDATVMPPKYLTSFPLRDQPGWVTFSIDGKYAYPSSGEVIDVKAKKIVTTLQDENGKDVASEKMLEIDFKDGQPMRAGDQFGIGRKRLE